MGAEFLSSPQPFGKNSTDRAIDAAIHWAFQHYGSDLGAFFRDADQRMGVLTQSNAPLASYSGTKQRTTKD